VTLTLLGVLAKLCVSWKCGLSSSRPGTDDAVVISKEFPCVDTESDGGSGHFSSSGRGSLPCKCAKMTGLGCSSTSPGLTQGSYAPGKFACSSSGSDSDSDPESELSACSETCCASSIRLGSISRIRTQSPWLRRDLRL
jgi:hypothetical protein